MISLPRDCSCGKANPQVPTRVEKYICYILKHVIERVFCTSILYIGEVFGMNKFLIDDSKV